MILISIYFYTIPRKVPKIPRNTTHNCMIYITFFIVILIDKRGVREAERLEPQNTTGTTPSNTGMNT